MAELLEGIGNSPNYDLFHAELLRETGRFEEAVRVLESHHDGNDRWVVNAMLREIGEGNRLPFKLIDSGTPVV